MFQRDYLQRMIERFGELLQRLISLRLDNLPDEAEDLSNEVFDSYFPFPADKVRHTPLEDMSSFIAEYPDLTEDHWTILADLLKEEGERWYQKGEWEAGDASVKKAILILTYLNKTHPDIYSIDRQTKLNNWNKRLTDE